MKYLVSITLILVALLVLVACVTSGPSPTQSPLPTDTLGEKSAPLDILQALLDFCVNAGIPLILGLCALDIAFGVGVALRSGVFDWKRVGQFYKTQVLALFVPYIVTLAVVTLVVGIVDFLPAALAPATMLAGILAKLAGSIVSNGAKLNSPA